MGEIISPRHPSPSATSGFRFSFIVVAPHAPGMLKRWWLPLSFSLALMDRPLVVTVFLEILLGYVASTFRGVGVGFGGPHLELIRVLVRGTELP